MTGQAAVGHVARESNPEADHPSVPPIPESTAKELRMRPKFATPRLVMVTHYNPLKFLTIYKDPFIKSKKY